METKDKIDALGHGTYSVSTEYNINQLLKDKSQRRLKAQEKFKAKSGIEMMSEALRRDNDVRKN